MNKRGFTLVELMIVVAIIGVLAALAIYGVATYLKHAKTAEATRALGAIETGARQQYQRETPYGSGETAFNTYVHTFCDTTPRAPTVVPSGRKVVVPPAEWTHVGWACLKFSMNEPQFYAYKYDSNSGTGTAATYTATAAGDLDGDGTTALFELVGRGGPMGDAIRDALRVLNEDE